MRSFNVLDPNAPLLGPKILEASAGTGKTFAIEQLFVRLLQYFPQEQILVITFTRAAARELRARIRANLRKIHGEREQRDPLIEKALLEFDRAQIFTIHGFCHRILTRFALESHTIFSEEEPSRSLLKNLVAKELAQQEVLAPEQLGILLKKRTLSELCEALLDAPAPSMGGSISEDQNAILRAMETCPVRSCDIVTEFEQISSQYKMTGFKGDDFSAQLTALQNLVKNPLDLCAFRKLLLWKGSLLQFVSPENQKVRLKEKKNSAFFLWASKNLLSIFEEATHPQTLFRRLRFALIPFFDRLMEEKGFFSPDLLLERCWKASSLPVFCQEVQSSYQALIIDEFQDTDMMQWEMIERLFKKSTQVFCLVGDPKQSIYRFRKADLYTYFQARTQIGEEHCYSLDTNYRSTPELLSALNELFCDEHVQPWLWLPKDRRTESYLPLKAGLSLSSELGDEKKALQFFRQENPLFYVAGEILRLKPIVLGYSSFAVLVKDHAEAGEVQEFLQKQGIPASVRNKVPLAHSLAFSFCEERLEQLCSEQESYSLPSLLRTLVNDPKLNKKDSLFLSDLFEVVEHLLASQANSWEQIKRVFRSLELDEVIRRQEQQEDAVRILTIHASKGLEFDIVFALGIVRSSPKEEELEEQEAEQLRHLYVALTRAKRRLYLPFNELPVSPLGLFFQRSKFGKDFEMIVSRLKEKNRNIGYDVDLYTEEKFAKILASHQSGLAVCSKKQEQGKAFPSFPPIKSQIYSYSSLARPKESGCYSPQQETEEQTLHQLPRGSEVGVTIHRIFERIFSENQDLKKIVLEEAELGSLTPWQETLYSMVESVLDLPLRDGCSLNKLQPNEIRVEVEFLFSEPPHFLKGFIDLLFSWKGKLYFLDWKTNWLGENDLAYTQEAIDHAMDQHDYRLQASLYEEALRRAFPHSSFGGAYYLFLRGIHAETRGLFYLPPSFQKKLNFLEKPLKE